MVPYEFHPNESRGLRRGISLSHGNGIEGVEFVAKLFHLGRPKIVDLFFLGGDRIEKKKKKKKRRKLARSLIEAGKLKFLQSHGEH